MGTRHRPRRPRGAVAAFLCSIAIEAAQGRWTDTKAVEAGDVEANVIGIALGTVSVAFCYPLYSAVSVLWVKPRPR